MYPYTPPTYIHSDNEHTFWPSQHSYQTFNSNPWLRLHNRRLWYYSSSRHSPHQQPSDGSVVIELQFKGLAKSSISIHGSLQICESLEPPQICESLEPPQISESLVPPQICESLDPPQICESLSLHVTVFNHWTHHFSWPTSSTADHIASLLITWPGNTVFV